MNEDVARRILEQAITEQRCAELLSCLFEGGSATIDAGSGRLVLVAGDQLSALLGDHPDTPGDQP